MKVIITGSTGMVGKGVLFECLESSQIESVLVINRASIDIKHEKLKEVIHTDFSNFTSLEEVLAGYDACFFCLGVSAVGMSEEKYTNITYDLTLRFANTLLKVNKDIIFNYVSGTGTDSSEKGRSMWARVKGKTENDLMSLPFQKAYMFRPGVIIPQKGIKSKTPIYNAFYVIFKPLLPVLKSIAPKSVTTTTQVGQAMIKSVTRDYANVYLENRDINELATIE